jgi:hypothetical protein
MNPIVFNIIAVICGIVVGSAMNMLIIYYGPLVIPPPEGVDTTTAEGLKAGMNLMKPVHYIVPFVAHFAGTFVGAFVAARIAVTHKMKFALGIGFFFLLGGIAASFMIPAPLWFIAVDLLLAYIPAAYFAGKLITK